MAKTTRGKGLLKVPSRGRGVCPVCLSTRIKVLYTVSNSEGKQLKVCKNCKGATAERIAKAVDTKTLAFRRHHKKEFFKIKESLVSSGK